MKWTKPSGVEVETNDMPETIEYCRSLGWREAGPAPAGFAGLPEAEQPVAGDVPKRRGRPPKDSTE